MEYRIDFFDTSRGSWSHTVTCDQVKIDGDWVAFCDGYGKPGLIVSSKFATKIERVEKDLR